MSGPVNILYKSIAGRYRPVRVADGPITDRYRFIKNASYGKNGVEFTRRSCPKVHCTVYKDFATG